MCRASEQTREGEKNSQPPMAGLFGQSEAQPTGPKKELANLMTFVWGAL